MLIRFTVVPLRVQLAVVFISLLGCTALAQDKLGRPPDLGNDPTSAASRRGAGVSNPKVIHYVDPKYTKEARKAHLQGVVVLSVVVGADGVPREIKVRRSLGMGLDEEAIKALNKWRYRPSMKDGQPVAVMITVEMNFRLWDDLGPPLDNTGAPYRPTTSLTWLEINKSKYPLMVLVSDGYFDGSETSATVTYKAAITEAGQQREMSISCFVTAPHCFVLRDGTYPARWQETTKLEIMGISEKKLDWSLSEYNVVEQRERH